MNFDKQDKMQRLTKFSQNLYMGFRATLKFRKLKVALNPYVQNFLKPLPKVASYPRYQNLMTRKKFTGPFLKYERLKLKRRVFLADHSVAMVTYCATKMIPTCSPVIGHFLGTMIIASLIKSGNNEPSKSVLESARNCFEPP